MGGLLWNTAALSSESQQPPYGPAPAPLDGPELPSFRFPLGAQKTEQFNGGTAKEANVTSFPVSEKLAGVYMTLQPGALRELRWHANAAEWAYVLEGNCRVTTIDPLGHARSSTSARAMSGTSRAGMATRSRVLDRAPAPSSSCSTTAISRSSAPSRSPTGSVTRRPKCLPGISACRLRPSPTFPRRKSISPPGRCRRRFHKTRAGLAERAAADASLPAACR
jgi:hypothetical protein